MQKTMRKVFTPKLKLKIALEALKGQRTIAEISGIYDVHPTQIAAWKKRLLVDAEEIFSSKRKTKQKSNEEFVSTLYERIGKKDVEIAWLKKKIGLFDD